MSEVIEMLKVREMMSWRSQRDGLRLGALSLIVVCGAVSVTGCANVIRPQAVVPLSSPTTTTSTAGTSTTGSTSTGTTTTGTSTTSAAAATFGSVANFGDSISCGYYASPNDGVGNMYSMEGYATLFDSSLKVTAKNLCRGGDQAADMARLWVYPNTMPKVGDSALYTVMIGTNDAHFCGPSDRCTGNWSQSLMASLSWLALPLQDKVLAQDMMGTGDWVPDMGFGRSTSGAGETLSFTVEQAVAGRSLYVAYRVFDPAEQPGGVATVTVDGQPVAVLNAVAQMATQNGTQDTVFVAQVPLGAVGEHTVAVTTGITSDGAGEFFSVLWAGVSTASYASMPGAPTVLIGQVPITGNDDLNGWVSQYNALLTPLVAELAAEGLNVSVAPTHAALVQGDLVDLLHPGNAGHAKLAAAFASALPRSDP